MKEREEMYAAKNQKLSSPRGELLVLQAAIVVADIHLIAYN
jgi:hypothetical protein